MSTNWRDTLYIGMYYVPNLVFRKLTDHPGRRILMMIRSEYVIPWFFTTIFYHRFYELLRLSGTCCNILSYFIIAKFRFLKQIQPSVKFNRFEVKIVPSLTRYTLFFYFFAIGNAGQFSTCRWWKVFPLETKYPIRDHF